MKTIAQNVNTASGAAGLPDIDVVRDQGQFQRYERRLTADFIRGDANTPMIIEAEEYAAWLESVVHAAQSVGSSVRSAVKRWGYAVVAWLLVAVALFAVAWTGFDKTWLSGTNLGWSGLGAAFVWGLVTPAALDLLSSAIDRLRAGARVYYAQVKPQGD